MKIKNIIKTIILCMIIMLFSYNVSKAGYSASVKSATTEGKIYITITSSEALDAYNLDLEDSRRTKICKMF